MNKKILLITGGTGGHVIPAENFAFYLNENDIQFNIIIDHRGNKFINNFKSNVKVINASSLNGNLFYKLIGSIKLLIGLFQSIFLILYFKPKIVISFGSYASLSPLLACLLFKKIMKIRIYIHEQNTIVGRTNKFFIKFVDKIFLNFDIRNKIKKKFLKKTFIVGTPEKLSNNFKINHLFKNRNNFTISIYGGSQGSEYLVYFVINLIKNLDKNKINNFNFIIQCPNYLISNISNELKNMKCNFIINDYYKNIENILKQSSLVISRAGAGTINDLIKFKIPSILVPLPNSKDNHQFENAKFLKNLNVAIIHQQGINNFDQIKEYINDLVNNNTINAVRRKFNNIKSVKSNELMYSLISHE